MIIFILFLLGISVAPVPPGSDASILNVGIGLNYGGIDASVINRVHVFCPNASTDSTRRFTINGESKMETDVLRHGPLSGHGGTCVRYACRLSVHGVSQPFSRMSVVCFESKSFTHSFIHSFIDSSLLCRSSCSQ